MMKKITIRLFDSSQIDAVVELQTAYAVVYPEAQVLPGEIYLSPAFEGGRNVFCAFDERGGLVGYAPLYPTLIRDASNQPHTLWTEVKVHPSCDSAKEVKDQLFEQVLVRAREVTADFPGHPVHLTFQYFPSETASIEYVLSQGCQHTESVFTMRRDLSREISSPAPVKDVVVRPWKMETEAEQQMYVSVRNGCFPEAPITLGDWQYFMQSPMWAVGNTFAAFQDDRLVGNVSVYWNEAENQQMGQKVGYTEFIFVHPDWRGKNIARALITIGLEYLKQHGLAEAHLEVRAANQSALRLYTGLGYEVLRESAMYVLSL